MAMAGRWSVDPRMIDDAAVTAAGIHGLPPSIRHAAHLRDAIELSHGEVAAQEAAKTEQDAAFWRRFHADGEPSGP